VDTVAVLAFVRPVFLGQCILGNACQAVVAVCGRLKPVMGQVARVNAKLRQRYGKPLQYLEVICFDGRWQKNAKDLDGFPKGCALPSSSSSVSFLFGLALL